MYDGEDTRFNLKTCEANINFDVSISFLTGIM